MLFVNIFLSSILLSSSRMHLLTVKVSGLEMFFTTLVAKNGTRSYGSILCFT